MHPSPDHMTRRTFLRLTSAALAGSALAACATSASAPAPTGIPVPTGAAAPTAAPPAPTGAATAAAPTSTTLTPAAIGQQLTAEGATLNFYWPAGGAIKQWITDTLIPGYQQQIKQQYGVRVSVNVLATGGGDQAFMQKLAAYEQASPDGNDFDIDVVRIVPSVDLVAAGAQGWMEFILPQHAALLPNLAHVNQPGLKSFTLDRGTYAIPVYQPTISLFYNADKVPTPPASLKDLEGWVAANPGRFTYEDPRSSSGIGSGSMFLLAVMHAFANPDDPSTYQPGFDYLSRLQPHIYPQPAESPQLIELMKSGELWMMVTWNDFGLATIHDQNITFMRNTFPAEGMPVRNTPIAVPRAAAHKMAGLLFIDYTLSDEVQRQLALHSRQIPASVSPGVWKDLPDTTFGFPFDYVQKHTFAAFNSQANLAGIKAMVDGFSSKVLQK
jgi:putative spermidine/putrescine transport system substrate-binding protein